MPYPKIWTEEKLSKLKSLYNSGLSMKEVAIAMKASLGSISHIMQRNNIERRPENETRKIQFLRSPLSFNEKSILSPEEEKLKIAGLMLYWAEGAKRNANRIDFANSDPEMIALFLKFLRRIYQIEESRFRVYLYSYNSLPTNELITYWSRLTHIPPT